MKKNKRPQQPKTRNKPMHDAMVELRRGSRTERHRDRSKYRRADWRNARQSGRIES